MKTLREMMDLIESAQAGVAEGYDDEEHPIRDDGNEGRPGKQRYPGKLPKKGQGAAEEQVEESTPDAMAKIDELYRD